MADFRRQHSCTSCRVISSDRTSKNARVSRLFDLAFTLHLCAQFGHLFEVLGDVFLVDIR
jgi:hypothetical protein